MYKKDMQSYFRERVSISDSGCWNWTLHCNEDGYGVVGLRKYRNQRAHRVSYEVFKGPIPDGLVVMHSCDNPRCCNPEHLSVGTHLDNHTDSRNKNRASAFWYRGAINPKSVLTDFDVRRIREMRASGRRYKEISAEIGCGKTLAVLVATGKRWSHVS